MEGDYGYPDISYFEFNIAKCHKDNVMHDPSVTCASDDQITEYVNNMRVNIYVI